ncbi:MAG: response regulator [Armatimonadota bacterium]
MKKPKILVVDDDIQNVNILKNILNEEGYDVVAGYNGEEAVSLSKEENPDLLILDIMMPKLDGFEVIEVLRKDEKTRTLPIVLLTSLTKTQDRIKGKELGCDDFITKPFDRAEIIARTSSFVKLNFYRSLQTEKEQLELIFKETADGLAVLDADWNIIRINQTAKNLLNITSEDTIKVNFLDHIYYNFTIPTQKSQLFQNGSRSKMFTIVRPESNENPPLYISAKLNNIYLPTGEVQNRFLVLRDVTEETVEERLKKNFLSLISHKLRTPVSIITGHLSMLKDEGPEYITKNPIEMINVLYKESVHLRSLVEKLLTFVNVTLEESNKFIQRIDLSVYLKEYVKSSQNQPHDKKVSFNIEYEESLPAVSFNPINMDLIINNIVENGIKFNTSEEAEIKISAKKYNNDFIQLSITDNGMGIPSEEYGKIFEKFYQVEKNLSGEIPGLGLGLSLVKQLIESKNGKVWLESELHKGTTFHITLPVFRY